MEFELVIKNGNIVDGSSNLWFKANIGIKKEFAVITAIVHIVIEFDPTLSEQKPPALWGIFMLMSVIPMIISLILLIS